jgi:integrase
MTSPIILSRASSLETIRAALAADPYLKSPHSRRQYWAALQRFENWRKNQPVTKTLVEAYLSHLQKRQLSPATINQHLAAVRWWARKIADLAADHMSDETATLIGKQAARVLTVKGVSGDRLPRGRYIPQSEFDRLIEACDRDPSPAGHRDAALFAVAIATGRRREELASLRLADITQKDDDHWILTFHNTKGNRDLTSDIFDGAVARLRLWLDRRITLDEGRVFIPILKSGRMRPAGRLSGEALRKILLARWVETGIPEPLTWHDFRRTLISNLIDDTDPVVAQKVVGHKDIKTTARYDRRPEAIRHASLKRIVHVPHKGEIHPERL